MKKRNKLTVLWCRGFERTNTAVSVLCTASSAARLGCGMAVTVARKAGEDREGKMTALDWPFLNE